jgi:hypothetical protein
MDRSRDYNLKIKHNMLSVK